MFDFDGTLSKIAKTPKDAYLKKSTKDLLENLSKDFYIAIISGRSLFDIKSKVGLPNLIYAGNHGLEWQIGKNKKNIKISAEQIKSLSAVKKEFQIITSKFKSLLLEDKSLTLSLHYRLLDSKDRSKFLNEVSKITSSIKKENIFSVTRSKKTIEIRPSVAWDKGIFANFLVKYLESKNHYSLLAFYVGDAQTDEDAFRALQKGITVRMGKKQQSLAHYFIKTNEIDKFLSWFVRRTK
jgi:trehalose-phosphatase